MDLQSLTNDDETMMIMMPVDCDNNDNVNNDNDRGCGDCRRVFSIQAPAVVLLVIYDITVKCPSLSVRACLCFGLLVFFF